MNRFYDYPLIVCGDFNSSPNSAILKLVETGNLDKDLFYDPGFDLSKEVINDLRLPEKVLG